MPEFFFSIYLPGREILLSRLAGRPGIWNGSPVSFAEAKALGESIEEQIGYRLSVRASNNPFLYRGDIEVRIERFAIGPLAIERAKAPFTRDIFYRIVFSEDRYVTMGHLEISGEQHWTCEDGNGIRVQVFNLFRSLLEGFEEAYLLGIYKAER